MKTKRFSRMRAREPFPELRYQYHVTANMIATKAFNDIDLRPKVRLRNKLTKYFDTSWVTPPSLFARARATGVSGNYGGPPVNLQISPLARPLTPGEIHMCQDVFRGALDTTTASIGTVGLTPFHTENTVTPWQTPWFPPNNYSDDFSLTPSLHHHFIHEMTHVLQTQQGNSNISDFLYLFIGNKFDYDQAYPFFTSDLGRPLHTFNFEQQAQIIARYSQLSPDDPLRPAYEATIGTFNTQPPACTHKGIFQDSQGDLIWGIP